jgi:hypothetical protein
MAWRKIPGNPYWEFNDESVSDTYGNMVVVAGVRTDGINQVYARVRRVGDPDDADRGEIAATFHNAKAGVYGVQTPTFYLSQRNVDGVFVSFFLSNGDTMITADGLTFTVLES